jgi:hypothetical protein
LAVCRAASATAAPFAGQHGANCRPNPWTGSGDENGFFTDVE